MDFENLVKQTKRNPFVSWPNYHFESYIDKKLVAILKDSKQEKCFEFYLDSTLVCYFQIKKLDWDSNHFGFNCAQLKHLYIDSNVYDKIINSLLIKIKNELFEYLTDVNFKLIFCDVDTSPIKNHFLQILGFKYIVNWIDGFVPVSKDLKDEISYDISLNENEIEIIAEIAKHNYFKGGRFYTDPEFEENDINNMYYSLVKNAYSNDELVLTIKHNGKPVGAFISKQVIKYTEFNNLKVAHLRFLVVDNKYRGMNFGDKLFKAILNHFCDKCDIVVTGLETCNIVSLNLHNKYRFKYNYTHNAYHLWL